MAIGLTNIVGFSGYRFTTALTGADAAMVYRVIDGPARIGSAGLVIDVLPVGVTMVTIRGGGVDTTFQLQGIGSVSERSILLAGRASAQTDAQARAAFGGAASASAGLSAVGLLKGGTVAPPAAALTMSFANPTVSIPEGNSGTTTVTSMINVVRNGVTGALTINLTYGGTATSGVDYTTAPTSLTIGAGVSSGSFDILINGDTAVELDETIIINAVEPTSGATASKTITISNDDAAAASWILATGAWNDTAPWDDTQLWKDAA